MLSIDKNTVESKNQVTDAGAFFTLGNPSAPVRVLVVGNSITRHAPKADIGWNHDFGMAASRAENDYVHLIKDRLGEGALVGVRQCAEWERNFDAEDILSAFRSCAEFGADAVVFRLGENVRRDIDEREFSAALRAFVSYINPKGGAVIYTTCFWHNERVDACIRAAAEKDGGRLAELGDLGEADENKALGLFAHEGVANHPGDLGMRRIADRISELLIPALREKE